MGTAGNAEARALSARMAAVTGSVARGFHSAAAAGTTSTAATTSATGRTVAGTTTVASIRSAATTETVSTRSADTRLSGAGLNLGGTGAASLLGHESVRSDLSTSLRSALAGFDAQTGFDQAVVTQLIGAQ